jgi:hypothetical protein
MDKTGGERTKLAGRSIQTRVGRNCIPGGHENHRHPSRNLRARKRTSGSVPPRSGSKVILTQEEVELLKQLKAAGGRGRTVSTLKTHDRLKRLVDAGYVTDQAASLDLVRHYRITKRGENALSEAHLGM